MLYYEVYHIVILLLWKSTKSLSIIFFYAEKYRF